METEFDRIVCRRPENVPPCLELVPRDRSLAVIEPKPNGGLQLGCSYFDRSKWVVLPVVLILASLATWPFLFNDPRVSNESAFANLDGVTAWPTSNEEFAIATALLLRTEHQTYLIAGNEESSSKALPSRSEIKKMAGIIANEEGVDPDLFRRLVRWESNYDINALSPKGAMGLAQLMPATAREMGLSPDRYFDPESNLRAGARYFKQQLDRSDSVALALAAYNAGMNRVRGRRFEEWPRETRTYVRRILPQAIIENRQGSSGPFVGGIATVSVAGVAPVTGNFAADQGDPPLDTVPVNPKPKEKDDEKAI
ncbi:MAG: lytic transglycosylase domain-containing protein [Pseudomonadota bacterium]